MSHVFYTILTCEAYRPLRGEAVRKTWLGDADHCFLSARSIPEESVVGWDTPDDFTSCPLKYRAFFQNMTVDADWIVLVDDDTFVYRPRLESHLATLDPSTRLYLGYCFTDTPSEMCMSGGAGIVLSRALYTAVCEYVRNTPEIPMDPKFSDVTLFRWVRSIPDVQMVRDNRFHWNAARSIDDQRTAFTFHYACPAHMESYMRGLEMDISILIPTMKSREPLFRQVLADIATQASSLKDLRVEILWESDNGELTLGQKRNVLMDRCSGKYHCFIDDDDVLAPDYLKTFVPMITSGIDYDCASFVGAHYNKGKFTKLFHHSLEYAEWDERPDRFIRTISPMNLIETSIVRQVRYKDIRNTEDHEFSKRLMASGLLKTEFKIDPNYPIYHYIDGVKADREDWQYSWNGPLIALYKPLPPTAFHVQSSSSGNVVYPFLKLSRS